ncbi:MAG: hypothetical protein ACLPVY_18615 [Acidimicrobiia bacterium]
MSPSSKRSSMQRALRARDAGLTKISIVTRAMVAGAVAATGLFSTLAAWAQPGRATSVGSSSSQVTAAGSSVQVGGGDDGSAGSDANLAPPTTLPAPSYQYSGPAVVSGAS